ncbi:hypothetical protein [Flavobacterium suncheonense]|uniref:hypothetical protein n=1 Tax=Flavobacterium suncheonense TaxID=350894 RepID=UPI00041FA627|nr:hypothetical protein [Flavobacterium suncheonense]
MKILQYTHYLYLILFVLFLLDGIDRVQKDENAVVSFLFAAMAVFMFFFRKKFSNRMNK